MHHTRTSRTSVFILSSLIVTGAAMTSSSAVAADLDLSGTITDVFGHHVVVDTGGKRHLVHIGPRIGEVGPLAPGQKLNLRGELKKSGEVRAYTILRPDGSRFEVGKDKQTWIDWLMGDDKDDDSPFTVEDARAIARDKGYVLDGEPTQEKKHFVASATKDGKSIEIDIHRDGTVKEQRPFTLDDARRYIAEKKVEIVGELKAVKRHVEAIIRRDGKDVPVHIHRDGEISEVDPSARK